MSNPERTLKLVMMKTFNFAVIRKYLTETVQERFRTVLPDISLYTCYWRDDPHQYRVVADFVIDIGYNVLVTIRLIFGISKETHKLVVCTVGEFGNPLYCYSKQHSQTLCQKALFVSRISEMNLDEQALYDAVVQEITQTVMPHIKRWIDTAREHIQHIVSWLSYGLVSTYNLMEEVMSGIAVVSQCKITEDSPGFDKGCYLRNLSNGQIAIDFPVLIAMDLGTSRLRIGSFAIIVYISLIQGLYDERPSRVKLHSKIRIVDYLAQVHERGFYEYEDLLPMEVPYDRVNAIINELSTNYPRRIIEEFIKRLPPRYKDAYTQYTKLLEEYRQSERADKPQDIAYSLGTALITVAQLLINKVCYTPVKQGVLLPTSQHEEQIFQHPGGFTVTVSRSFQDHIAGKVQSPEIVLKCSVTCEQRKGNWVITRIALVTQIGSHSAVTLLEHNEEHLIPTVAELQKLINNLASEMLNNIKNQGLLCSEIGSAFGGVEYEWERSAP